MQRRHFIAGAAAMAGAGPIAGLAGAAAEAAREYYELRRYKVEPGAKADAMKAFLGGVAVAAWNRLGVKPVGLFEPTEGDGSELIALLPHASLESVATLATRLADDAEYQRAGESILDAPKSDPAFKRIESSLLLAFEMMPKIEIPARNASRVYELRQYESHSARKAKKKVEMFNSGGEIALFLETGLKPVFFGEMLVGEKMPNLTYMISFEDMADHDKTWKVFVESEGWKTLSAKPEYKDTVSNITRTFLRALDGSQI